MPFTISLDGKVAVVTGASSGIGSAIARALASADASVVAIGRSTERLGILVRDIRKNGGEAQEIAADITTADAPENIVREALEMFGRIDCVVNCAGIFLLGPPSDSLELLDKQWRTNVRAPFALAIAALPELRRRKGSVIFLSSTAGKVGVTGGSAYCATKGAVELLTKSLALEEGANGVRFNAIAPGNVETAMNEHLMAEPTLKRAMIEATPLNRNGQVEDVAPLAVLLASGHANFTTGASILVDGGWTAQ